MAELWGFHEIGTIELRKSTAMDRDLDTDSGPGSRDRFELASRLTRDVGVWVLGVSRLELDTKLGSEHDAEVWDRLWQILNHERDRPSARAQHHRDALHIHTALAAGGVGFVTRDGSGKSRGLLDCAVDIAQQFNGFLICTPESALERLVPTSHED